MVRRSHRLPASPLALLLAGLVSAVVGCSTAWDRALQEDTSAGYYRYMREHPNSKHRADAEERLDFLKLKRDLNLRTYAAFLEKYPHSQLVAEIQPQLEPHAFQAARAAGTAQAYRGFVERFPRGPFAARAQGNMAYLEARGFGGRPDALAEFAQRHPESDYAAEAMRSVAAAALRGESRFDRVALSIEIAPSVPNPKRWRQRFQKIAEDAYAEAGIQLVVVPSVVDPATARRLPRARLTIRHDEAEQSTKIREGAVSRPGMVATTVVTLQREKDAPPIFQRTFTLRVDSTQHAKGTSVLSSTSSPRYWNDFFVPVGSWQTSSTVRPIAKLAEDPVAVDAVGDRAVVLYEDGSFQLIDLADPEKPVVLAAYERPKDLKKWSGVAILGDTVAIFGEEGIERVRFGPEGPQVTLALDRSQIGTVFALESVGRYLAAAGARGLILIDPKNGSVLRLMRRVTKGLAVVGDDLVFTDGESLYVSNLALLREQRVQAQMKLGKAFGLWRVRALGRRAVAIGHGGALVLDLSRPGKPVVTARLNAEDVGPINDASSAGGRIFLLGDRGLQMMDPTGRELVESIDVRPRARVASMGRHLVTVGEHELQVVDASPFAVASLPAAR